MTKLYFEDLKPGLSAKSGDLVVSEAEIKDFAGKFDPQAFHLDDAAARASWFGGLVASGWHTAAMTMRLMVDGGLQFTFGTLGAGVDELRWLTPVRPGDRLHIESELLEARPSQSKPDRGLAKIRTVTRNQAGTAVLSMTSTVVVPRRTESSG